MDGRKLNYIKLGVNLGLNHYFHPLSYHLNACLCKPYYIDFVITKKCCLKCMHCDMWKLPKADELTTEECKKVIKSLKDWMGCHYLNLSGGEPFMRKDLVELVSCASSKKIVTRVLTNGVLINKAKAEEVGKSGLDLITISLDGIKPKTHDYTRGVEGTHKKAVLAIKHLMNLEKGPKVSIATILMKSNLDEVTKLVDMVENKGLDGILFQPLGSNVGSNNETFWYEKTDLWPNYDEVHLALDKLIELKKSGARISNTAAQLELMKEYFKNPQAKSDLKCMVGWNNFRIDADGQVQLCYLFDPIGNIRSSAPEHIWKSEKAAGIRRGIKSCKRSCILMNCNYNNRLWDNINKFKMLIG